ncbi:hypothetical protein RRG08_051862 [Elysia crispata]|uniref:Uncharacterized protein n=1 Tax=Elysia crispata TaxID=231223 RepID=A0AAE1DDC0_9GAST|nr:hypothetical protein RRG08_051862 [Elysia crispata]
MLGINCRLIKPKEFQVGDKNSQESPLTRRAECRNQRSSQSRHIQSTVRLNVRDWLNWLEVSVYSNQWA